MIRPTSVGLVGLGTIAETHLAVLADIAEVTLAFVADPDPDAGRSVTFRGATPPSYPDIHTALGRHQPDLVVITTPTPTHADLTCQVLTHSTARVLVEKPLAHDLAALADLEALDPALHAPTRVAVAHHFAFSPEVQWAATQIQHHSEWGPVVPCHRFLHRFGFEPEPWRS
jgi:predicted dehydrogenase